MGRWISEGLMILGGLFGGYLGAYMAKKGESKAIHEDIDNLLQDIRKTTAAVKEIEAKISNEVWDRQRQWEIKKELLFELLTQVETIRKALMNELSLVSAGINMNSSSEWWQKKMLASQTTSTTLEGLLTCQFRSAIICGQYLADVLHTAILSFVELNRSVLNNHVGTDFMDTLTGTIASLVEAVRRELGLPERS